MEMTSEDRYWIDNASYEELLTKLRQEPINSKWLSKDTGSHLAFTLSVKRRQLTEEERVEIAKRVKWHDE
jgi:hypothetical protein